MTIFSPGRWANRASRDCECWQPMPPPTPPSVRITIGSSSSPGAICMILATWLPIWSMASRMKSMNEISATGRIPIRAAPVAVPMIADSQIGVSRTRWGPKRSSSPLDTLNTPP